MPNKKFAFFYARVFSDTNLYKVHIPAQSTFKYGAEVIIKTEFGTDLAVISSFKSEASALSKNAFTSGELIRYATAEDTKNKLSLKAKTADYKTKIKAIIKSSNLNMKLAHILIPLSQDSICIYYTADSRVDFRQLLIELRRHFKTKIILRQISQFQRENSFVRNLRI